MRLGKLLSVGEVTEAAAVAEPAEPTGKPAPPVSADAPARDGVREVPAAPLSR